MAIPRKLDYGNPVILAKCLKCEKRKDSRFQKFDENGKLVSSVCLQCWLKQ